MFQGHALVCTVLSQLPCSRLHGTPVLRTQYCVALRTPSMRVGRANARQMLRIEERGRGTQGSFPGGAAAVAFTGPSDAAGVQTGAAQKAAFFGQPFDALQSGSPPNASRLRDPSVGQAAPSSPLLMTDPGDLVTRALVILAEEGRSMAGAPGPRVSAAEHPVNSPSCGFVNKRLCVSAEAAAEPPIPRISWRRDSVSARRHFTDAANGRNLCSYGSMHAFDAARTGRLGAAMGRGGYARARRSDFSGNPSIGHGSGLSSAAGSRCHGGVPGERRPGPPGNRAIRAARPRCERAGISGAPAGPIRRNGGVSAGASLCRPADLSAPSGVRRMSPVSGGLRSGTGRDR